MANLISKSGKEVSLKDGSEIREAAEKLGVKFNCRDGNCCTCMVDVIEGEENLTPLTQQEKNLGLNKKERLACQCMIKEGEVKIGF